MAVKKRKLDPATGEPLPRALTDLPLRQGVAFGDWSLWRDRSGTRSYVHVYIIHAFSRCVVYLPTSSNGWINYRVGPADADDWYVVWSNGTVEPQQRTLPHEELLGRQPGRQLPADTYKAEDWTFRVFGDELWVEYLAERRMTFRRHSPKWACDKVDLPGV
jgi:hypothetical protein